MVRISEARRAALTIYFVFGVIAISWVPRIPEVKANLEISSAAFGVFTSFGTIGAIASTFGASKVIHAIGSRRSTAIFGTAAFLLVAAIAIQRSPWTYAPLMLCVGASFNALSAALNVQSLHIEERRGTPSMGAFHGSWAAGALATSLLSTALVGNVALTHQMVALALLAVAFLFRNLPRLISDQEEERQEEVIRARDLLRPSRTALLIGLGISGGSFAEYASGDWSALYVRETLGTSLSRAAFSFTFIMLAITASRLLGDRVIAAIGPQRVIRSGGVAILGGLSLVSLAGHMSDGNGSLVTILMTYTGFALTGLGSGVMVPTFISATTNIQAPRAVALGQVILIQQSSIWILKATMSAAVARFGLENAILIPAFVATLAIALSGLTAKRQPATQPTEQ